MSTQLKYKQNFLIAIAMVAHSVNRAYCEAIGDKSVPEWAETTESHKASYLNWVELNLSKPDLTPELEHEAWLAQKVAEGWTFGEVKDIEKKQHPCILPYEGLPAEQKVKDYLFRATVHSVIAAVNGEVGEAVSEALAKVQEQADLAKANVPTLPALTLRTIPLGHVAVRYIGRKEFWIDTLYGTGLTFTRDQVRAVPPITAAKFLRHADVFSEAETGAAPAAEVVVDPAADDTEAVLRKSREEADAKRLEESRVLDIKDQVNTMDKDALLSFAYTHFQQRLPANMKIDNMRPKVLALIDQFGVV